MVFLEYWLFWLLGTILTFGPVFFAKRDHEWARSLSSWYVIVPVVLVVSSLVVLATFERAHVVFGATTVFGALMGLGLAFAWPVVRLTLAGVSLSLQLASFYHGRTVEILGAFGPEATPWVLFIGHVSASLVASLLMAMWLRGFGNEGSYEDGVPDDHFSSILN